MKHLFKFLSFAAIAAMTAISCNKEIETPDLGTDAACPEGYYVEELTAVYPRDPETRTAFNETTGRFAWTEGDELAFHLSNGEYVAAPIDPATGKVKLYLPVGVTRDNYAVYPASAVVDEAAAIGNMKVTLPDTYDISADPNTDFVPTPLVAWNDAENTHLKFEHVGGLLQVNLNVPAGVKTATVSMGKTITGTFSLEDGTGNGIISPGASSADGVTFILSENGLAETTDVKLLTPLPTGTYDSFEIAYDNGYKFSKDLSANPWVFSRSGGKKVSIGENNFEDPLEYFWFEALEAGSTVWITGVSAALSYFKSMEYSFDKKEWTLVNWDEPEHLVLEHKGDRVWFRMNQSNNWGTTNARTFHGTGRLKVGGELQAIANYKREPSHTLYGKFNAGRLFYQMDCLEDARDLKFPEIDKEPGQYAYAGMFMNCTSLLYGPKVLPAKMQNPVAGGGGGYCYSSMFSGCSSLLEAPALPAENVTFGYYENMFRNCVSLTQTPDLSHVKSFSTTGCYCMFENCTGLKTASELNCESISNSGLREMYKGCTGLESSPKISSDLIDSYGCQSMFANCTGITSAGELSCTNLGRSAYQYMFQGCTGLLESPELPAEVAAQDCYASMFSGCSSLTKANPIHVSTQAQGWARSMFYNCSSLNEITVYFTDWVKFSGALATNNWLYKVAETGTFRKPASLPDDTRTASRIPIDWTVVNF